MATLEEIMAAVEGIATALPGKADLGGLPADNQQGWDTPLVDQSIIVRTTTPTGYTGPADQRKCDLIRLSSLPEEASPTTGDWLLCEESGGLLKKVDIGNLPSGGGDTHPIADSTAIVKDPADTTKLLRVDVGGTTTGVTGVLAAAFTTAKTLTMPDATDTLVGKATTDTLTNKTLTTPTIGDFTNAGHTHAGASSGGTIAHSATTGQGTDDHHAQSHTVASHSDTTATGAELETLTDGSETTLHIHDGRYFTESEHLNTSAGAGDAGKPIKLDAAGHVDATMVNDGDIDHANLGNVTANQHHNESHAVASHSDTTATGAELETLTDGSDADALHTHPTLTDQNLFKTINCPAGTDPVADATTDTLNLTSANTKLTITGNSTTDTVDFAVVEGAIDHDALLNFAAGEHFTEASIDHTAITNIGTNAHSVIDTHIADGTKHFLEGSIDHGSIGGLTDDDHTGYLLADGSRALSGTIVPSVNNTVDLGSSLVGWKDIYVAGSVFPNELKLDDNKKILLGTGGDGEIYGDGANIVIDPLAGQVVIGSGAVETDYALKFDGETNDGIITWMEDEDYFKLSDGFLIDADRSMYFRNTDTNISSPSSGVLRLNANSIRLRAGSIDKITVTSTQVVVSDNFSVSGYSEAKGFFDTYIGYTSRSMSAGGYGTMGDGIAFSATRGFVAPYDGYINSICASVTCVGAVFAAWKVFARIDGTNAIGVVIGTGTSGSVNVHNEEARGTAANRFSAGDVISFYWDETSGSSSLTNGMVHCRVQYDD